MDSGVIVAALGLIGSIIVVIIANRYTARTAREAQARTAEIELSKIGSTSWKDQVDSWREDVKQLRERMQADNLAYTRKLEESTRRIDELERRQEVARREYNAVLLWARQVVVLLRQANVQFPAPPPGVMDTDPDIPRVRG